MDSLEIKELLDLTVEAFLNKSDKANNYTLSLVFPFVVRFETPDETRSTLQKWVVSTLAVTEVFSCEFYYMEKRAMFANWHIFRIRFSSDADIEKWTTENNIELSVICVKLKFNTKESV